MFLQTCRLTRPTITARTGFALVYLSISCGFLFFTISDFAAHQFEFWWAISRFGFVQAVSQLAPLPMFLSIIAAALAGAGVNSIVSRGRSAKWLASWSNDVRAALIIKSIEESSLIEISLTNRKSYIGWVISPPPMHSDTSGIEFQVLLSGYRDEETLELAITDDYIDVLGPEGDADVYITIPLSSVLTMRPFDLRLYRQFMLSHTAMFSNAPPSTFMYLSREKINSRKQGDV